MTATTEQLAPWQRIFRAGLAPELPDDGLLALLAALETDDPRLIQKRTTQSLAPWAEPDVPVCAACVIGFAGRHGEIIEDPTETGYQVVLAMLDDGRILILGRDHLTLYAKGSA